MPIKIEKHCTSSLFIFHQFNGEWKLLLVHHKKFNRWMIPGGHVEQDENPAETVLREVYEETALKPKLISFIHKKLKKTDSQWLLPPEYFFEQKIPVYAGEAEHFHLDCAYVAIADDNNMKHRTEELNDIKWFSESELRKNKSMFLTTQKIATILFNKFSNNNLKVATTFMQI